MSNHTDDEKNDGRKMGRRAFLGKFTAAVAGGVAAASALGNGNEAEAATPKPKPKGKPTEQKCKFLNSEPLQAQAAGETAKAYGERYKAYFDKHAAEYKQPMLDAMMDANKDFPICGQVAPGYKFCVMPAGQPFAGTKPFVLGTNQPMSLPTILLDNPVAFKTDEGKVMNYWKEWLTNETKITPNGVMTIKIKIDQDGATVGVYGGMKGCKYKITKKYDDDEQKAVQEKAAHKQDKLKFGQWESFPLNDKEQQKILMPPPGAAKKGDIVEIEIPKSVFMLAASQYEQYQRGQQLQQAAQQGQGQPQQGQKQGGFGK